MTTVDPCESEGLSRILVIRGGAIGDFILTLPAIKLLRDAFPCAHLEILGYRHIISLAEVSGYANATRSIEYGPLASFFAPESELASELVEYFQSFQQIVSYLFDPDDIFASNLRRAGARNVICASSKISDREHAARQLARPLEKLGLYLENAAAQILPNETRLPDPNLIAIHPGSGSESKNWPLPGFVEVAGTFLDQNPDRRLLLVGGEADAERLTKQRAALPNERLEIAENLPLTALAKELCNCAAFIGHDSGISHLAAAVGTPSLLLYGPTDPAIWAPQNPNVRILRGPTLRMKDIDPPAVMMSLGKLMS
jgi:heptosyltransferase-2